MEKEQNLKQRKCSVCSILTVKLNTGVTSKIAQNQSSQGMMTFASHYLSKKKACNGIITEYVICSLVQRTTALNTVITPVSPMPMQSALPKGSSNESLHAQGQFMPCIRIYLRNLTPCSWEKAGLFLPNSLRALLPEFTQAP